MNHQKQKEAEEGEDNLDFFLLHFERVIYIAGICLAICFVFQYAINALHDKVVQWISIYLTNKAVYRQTNAMTSLMPDISDISDKTDIN